MLLPFHNESQLIAQLMLKKDPTKESLQYIKTTIIPNQTDYALPEVLLQCHQCTSLTTLPKVLLEDKMSIPQGIATNCSADAIERSNQMILIVCDNLSQFIKGTIFPDQTADTLREVLLSLTLNILPDSGAKIHVDGATAFQALCREAITKCSLQNQLKITIEV